MKERHDTFVLILFLYPFVALPLGFLMMSMGWANDLTFMISLVLAISGLSVLSYDIIKEKLIDRPKYRAINNDHQSFYFKNRYKKLTLRYG